MYSLKYGNINSKYSRLGKLSKYPFSMVRSWRGLSLYENKNINNNNQLIETLFFTQIRFSILSIMAFIW